MLYKYTFGSPAAEPSRSAGGIEAQANNNLCQRHEKKNMQSPLLPLHQGGSGSATKIFYNFTALVFAGH
jgi:hypothetical protein